MMVARNPIVEAFRAAAEDRTHGAGEIEAALLRRLLALEESWSGGSLRHGAHLLLAGQPAMANLRALARRLGRTSGEELGDALRGRLATLEDLPRALGEAAWPFISGLARLVTSARSSAVAFALTAAWERGWRGQVVVLDGTPAGRGLDQARELERSMRGVISQPDGAAPGWLENAGGAVGVMVGADAVGERSFLNACGTRMLLELARERLVPRLVIADTGKDVEEAEVGAMLASGPSRREAGPGRTWPVFERVPLSLATGRISERGEYGPGRQNEHA